MIFDDARWTDPTSLEVFGRIVDQYKVRQTIEAAGATLRYLPPLRRSQSDRVEALPRSRRTCPGVFRQAA